MKLVHGGDYVGYRERYGRDAVDFSANVSPLGVPAGGCAARSARRRRRQIAIPIRFAVSFVRRLRDTENRARRLGAVRKRRGRFDFQAGTVLSGHERALILCADVCRIRGGAGDGWMRAYRRYELSERNDFALTAGFCGRNRRECGHGVPLPA